MKSNKKLKKNRLLRNRCKERKRRRRNNTLFFEYMYFQFLNYVKII